MTSSHEEHLKMWARSVLITCLAMIGDLPSVPVITGEFDQCLGRVERELELALSLIKTGNAFQDSDQ